MNKVFIFFLFFLGLFITPSTFALNKIPPEPYYCKIIDRITHKYLKEYILPQGLDCICIGGSMVYDVKMVALGFVSYKALNVDEARKLYVNIVEEYLHRVNCNEEVRPYLHNYPFTINNLEFTIRFSHPNGKRIADGHVAYMSFIASRNLIFYSSYDYKIDDFQDLHQESYEEALKIVQESSHLKTNTTSP